MGNLRGLLDIKRIYIPECTVKGVMLSDERIDEGVHVSAMWRELRMAGLLRESIQGSLLVIARRGTEKSN